jgi:hypothetical protein
MHFAVIAMGLIAFLTCHQTQLRSPVPSPPIKALTPIEKDEGKGFETKELALHSRW